MKKLFFVVAFAATTLISNAQAKFGAKLGGNFYTLGGDDTKGSDIQNKVGFNFGFLYNIPVSEHFSVQPEAFYSIQGAQFDNLAGVSGDRINYNFNYLNVPVMLQFTSDGGFYGEFGPQIGFLMSAKADSKIGNTSSDVSIKDQLKGTDFSLCLGLGYKSPGGFGVGGRYNVGMNNINDNNNSDLKNRGFQIDVFYRFAMGPKDKGKGKDK
jgi:hypothetical protein